MSVGRFVAAAFNALVGSSTARYSFLRGIRRNIWSPREEMLETAMKYAAASKLEGDYFEFGVFGGKTLGAAYHISRTYLPHIQFVAFDSFQGLPAEEGAGGFEQFKVGEFSASEAEFRRNLARRGVDMSRVDIVPGWYQDTLTEATRAKLPSKKAAIVNVDCDLYESAALVLDFITPYLEDGSLILFDDWFTYRGRPDRGEQKAFSEWCQKHPSLRASQYQTYNWSGNSFIVHP
jgi:O-methyltransferase